MQRQSTDHEHAAVHKGHVSLSNKIVANPTTFNPQQVTRWERVFARMGGTSLQFFESRKDKHPTTTFSFSDDCCFEVADLQQKRTILLYKQHDNPGDEVCFAMQFADDADVISWANILSVQVTKMDPSTGVIKSRRVSMMRQSANEMRSDLDSFLRDLRGRPVSASNAHVDDDELEDSWRNLDDNAKALSRRMFGGGHGMSKSEMKQLKSRFSDYAKDGKIDENGLRKLFDKYSLNPTEQELRAVMKGGTKHVRTTITIEEFIPAFVGFTTFRKVRELFDEFDKDKSNSIDLSELVAMLQHLNLNPTKKHAKQLLEKYDTDKNGTLEFLEFLQLYAECALETEVGDSDMRRLFKMFDLASDGVVHESEVRRVLMTTGEKMSEGELDRAFNSIKLKVKGQMDYHEFCLFLRGLM